MNNLRLNRSAWCALSAVMLAVAGCATPQPGVQGPAGVPAPIAQFARPDGSVRFDTQDPEVAKLWTSAENARNEGQPNISLELLYEAMEIEPQNSLLWSRAAEIQLDALKPELAENFAAKSNSFANDNRPLLFRNWLIIEHARDMRGDLLGVRSAHKQVQFYQYQ